MNSVVDYMPMDRRHALVHGATLPEHTIGAVLFADLAGFTPVTEAIVRALGPSRGAEELFMLLDRIYEPLMSACDRYGGSVVGYGGDAITVWFDGGAESNLVEAGCRAVACAQAMQEAMGAFRTLSIPGGQTLKLALKTTVTTGPVRRLLVGDANIQLVEVLAGATMSRLDHAAHLTMPGEVVADSELCRLLGERLRVADYRSGENDPDAVAILAELAIPVDQLPLHDFVHAMPGNDAARAWVLPAIYARLQSGQGEFIAELRHTVSFFLRFTDLDYDDDEDAGKKLGAFVRWVQQVLARYESALLQVTIGDKGSYLYASFGAPVAHGDDAARAVAAALELREPPAELQWAGPVQIGISSGQTRAGAAGGSTRFYSVEGDSVNLAARLMQAANPGQILITANLAPSIGRRYELVQLPPRKLKGKAEPVPLFAIGETRAMGQSGLQEPQYTLPLVGRTAELALLQDKLAQASQGNGQIVGITGEAGMGKSRLIAEMMPRARDAGYEMLGGAAQSTGTQIAYLAWQPIWRAFFHLDPRASVEEQRVALERALRALDPALLPRLPLLGIVLGLPLPDNDLTRGMDPKARKESLERLLVDCLRARFAPHDETRSHAPLLLILEDTHWLDALSIDLLTSIGRALVGLPVLLIMAYRPSEPGQSGRPFPFAGQALATEIHLTELPREEAAQLIEHKAALISGSQVRLPAPFVQAIIDRTEGNPFYIEELLSFLQDRGVRPGDMPAFTQLELPGSLASLILSRIDQLSSAQQTTVKVASIIGRVFRMAWLWGVYPGLGEHEQVRQDLDMLARVDITPLDTPEPDLSYLFKHATIQQVAYESIPFALRAQLHDQLASWLETQMNVSESLDLLAFHFGRSSNTDKQREYFKKAGDAAAGRYANAAAIEYYERLVGIIPIEEQPEILSLQGRLFQRTSAWDDAIGHFGRALDVAGQVGKNDVRIEAKLRLGSTEVLRMNFEAAHDWLEQARQDYEARGDHAGLSETLLEIGRTYFYERKPDQAKIYAEQVLALEGENGNKPRIAQAMHVLGSAALLRMDLAQAREWWLKSIELKRELGDKMSLGMTIANVAMVAYQTGRLDEAQSQASESIELFQELQARYEYGMARTLLGLVLSAKGEAASAVKMQAENVALFRDLGMIPVLDFGFIGLADAAQLAERSEAANCYAVTLIAAGTRIVENSKAPRMPFFQVVADRVRKRAMEHLDQETLDRVWAEGHAMEWPQAIAYALERVLSAG